MGKEKEKITYVDDGSTIADMSNLPESPLKRRDPSVPRPTFREAWGTYWSAVKMMFLPMLAFAGGLVVLYFICYLLFTLAA